jgi:hypothetical protein
MEPDGIQPPKEGCGELLPLQRSVASQLASGKLGLWTEASPFQRRWRHPHLYKDGAKLSAEGGKAITAIGAGGFGAGNVRHSMDSYTAGQSIDNFDIVEKVRASKRNKKISPVFKR